jgi:uncharacterized membrane protein HdeD (DUF308 family)
MTADRIQKQMEWPVRNTNPLPLALVSLALTAAGVLLIASRVVGSRLIFLVLGGLLVLFGIGSLLSLFKNRREWGWRVAWGIGSIAIGAVFLARPLGVAYLAYALIIWAAAAAFALAGIGLIIFGLGWRPWWLVFPGVICLPVSLALAIKAPELTAYVPWVLALAAVLGGGAGLLSAFRKALGKG